MDHDRAKRFFHHDPTLPENFPKVEVGGMEYIKM